jgi:hypothetical protein
MFLKLTSNYFTPIYIIHNKYIRNYFEEAAVA